MPTPAPVYLTMFIVRGTPQAYLLEMNVYLTCHMQRRLQVDDLRQQLAKSRAACSDMLSLGSLLDRERIQKARLQADLSAARIDRCVHH
jgi:ABC-type phosphate transport system auxiliary subunit